MRDETLYRPAELVQLLNADCRAVLAIAERYRSLMTPVEAAVLQSVADSLRRRALEKAKETRA